MRAKFMGKTLHESNRIRIIALKQPITLACYGIYGANDARSRRQNFTALKSFLFIGNRHTKATNARARL